MGSNTAITVLTRIISTSPRFVQVNMLIEDSWSTWIRIIFGSWIRIRIPLKWKAVSGSGSKWKAVSGSASKWKAGSGSASKWKGGSFRGSFWNIGSYKSGKRWVVGSGSKSAFSWKGRIRILSKRKYLDPHKSEKQYPDPNQRDADPQPQHWLSFTDQHPAGHGIQTDLLPGLIIQKKWCTQQNLSSIDADDIIDVK